MERRVCTYVSFLWVLVFQAMSPTANTHDLAKIGLNYGMQGDNLPPPPQVVALYKNLSIPRVRLFDPNAGALEALRGSGIAVHLGVTNNDVIAIATSHFIADQWVAAHVKPYVPDVNITYVSAGNELVNDVNAAQVNSAILALQNALNTAGFRSIKVTTTVSTSVLSVSYPPSQGAFTNGVATAMTSIATFLAQNQIPLFINVYPYFAYSSNPANVSLEYALFISPGPVVHDGTLSYQNLFDAMVDSIYSALEKVGGSSIELGIGETGWPSDGNPGVATIDNAKAYTNNLVSHIALAKGTPKRPGKLIETYIFATFNEDLKAEGIEQNFGLFFPNQAQVYPVNFFPTV
ncbi:putative glucan endo-1,3-beta-glucosidase GVI [Amborella trichopoda]|uniref:putative glucan endo-1,3-beta-glucosidase GVI n=1 Tax=Amborella trichopoda TaxID=13333 RepID=UPI0005D3CFFE|nr:putative glucan endo-1,3-beta-glucosidase GVI [Amborella trichopoda]|eukprot:XP_006843456.2 putative glucan endo-1,3-beta-glucosidase GVI [Amborella trichopoda]